MWLDTRDGQRYGSQPTCGHCGSRVDPRSVLPCAATAEHRRHRRRGRADHHRLAADSSSTARHWYNHVSVVTRRHLIDDARLDEDGATVATGNVRLAFQPFTMQTGSIMPREDCAGARKRRLTMSLPRLRIREAVSNGVRGQGHLTSKSVGVDRPRARRRLRRAGLHPHRPEPDIATDIELLLTDVTSSTWMPCSNLTMTWLPGRGTRTSSTVGALFWSRPQVLRGQDAASLSLRWDGRRLIHEAPSSVEDVRMLRFAWFPAQGDVRAHWAETP